MATATNQGTGRRLSKPSLTNMPYEVGIQVIDQIVNSPVPDFSDTEAEVQRIRNNIREKRKKKAQMV